MQYAEFNLKLLGRLLIARTDYFLANDLDSLLPNYVASRLRLKKIFYDTHEYFTGVPELKDSPVKKKIWKALEDWIFPRLPIVYTVNDSVRQAYEKEYPVQIEVIRNVPVSSPNIIRPPIPPHWKGKKILLMQGAGINNGRGGIELLAAMRLLDEQYHLVYIGSGTQWDLIAEKRVAWKLEDRVDMIGKVAPAQLKGYTALAHIGFSLDSFDDINYLFNLPNKIFDYIQAGVPVIATAIPEVKKIIEGYNCGTCIPDLEPGTIANATRSMIDDQDSYHHYQQNCKNAAIVLCWENESKKLENIYRPFL